MSLDTSEQPSVYDRPDPFDGRYRSELVKANGLQLHITQWNPHGDRPALLVHGLSAQCHSWDLVANLLSSSRRVICLDLRGHGDSEWAIGGYRVPNFVQDIRAVVDGLGIGPFDYIGHSLGGHVGIAYAGQHPETVRRLILNDLGPEMPRTSAESTRNKVTERPRGFRSPEDAEAYFRTIHLGWQDIAYQLTVRHQLRKNWADKLVFKADPELSWLMGSIGKSAVPYVWEMASKISAPTMLLRSATSGMISDDILDRMKNVITGMRAHTLPVGHHMPREDPAGFTALATEFLDSTN